MTDIPMSRLMGMVVPSLKHSSASYSASLRSNRAISKVMAARVPVKPPQQPSPQYSHMSKPMGPTSQGGVPHSSTVTVKLILEVVEGSQMQ